MNEASILGIDEGDAIVSCLLIFGLWWTWLWKESEMNKVKLGLTL